MITLRCQGDTFRGNRGNDQAARLLARRAVFERRLFALARGCRRAPRGPSSPPPSPSSLCRCQRAQDAGGSESGLDEVSRLRAAMDQAIEEEDYETAASIRDQVKKLTDLEQVQVAEANQRFYDAFESGSTAEMARVWGQGDHCRVIHPGLGCIMGRDQVMISWKQIFTVGGYKIEVGDVEVHTLLGGRSAMVTCVEYVDSGSTKGKIAATNVFEKQGGQWKIVHHHGSSSAVQVENPWTI